MRPLRARLVILSLGFALGLLGCGIEAPPTPPKENTIIIAQ